MFILSLLLFNAYIFYFTGEPILPHLLFIWSSPNFILKDLAWILVNPCFSKGLTSIHAKA